MLTYQALPLSLLTGNDKEYLIIKNKVVYLTKKLNIQLYSLYSQYYSIIVCFHYIDTHG